MLILGDSITLGATEVFGDRILSTTQHTFVHDLRADLPGWHIHCDAALYRTTTDATQLLPAAIETHRPHLLLLMLGGNDADLDWKRFIASRGRRTDSNVPIERYAANLAQIVSDCHEAGVTPVLTDVPSLYLAGRLRWLQGRLGVSLSRAVDANGGGAQAQVDGRCQEYNDAVASIARAGNLPLCRWAADVADLPPEQRFGPDFVHPGAAAHRLIARAVLHTLRPVVAGSLVSSPGPASEATSGIVNA